MVKWQAVEATEHPATVWTVSAENSKLAKEKGNIHPSKLA